jgi:hypothetical protein
MKTVVAALAVLLLASACAGVDRSAAIEACSEARNLFASVPNPRAGQAVPENPMGRACNITGDCTEPDFTSPRWTDIDRRVARVRSLAAESGDKTLQGLADGLARNPNPDTAPLLSHCSREGY